MDYQNNGYQQNNAQAMDWDADFEAQESVRSPLLPEGDYWFEVVKVERGRHNGTGKIPACNKAIVTFRILAPQGEAVVKENYYLLNEDWRLEMMTAFFASIGIARQGEKRVKPVWTNEIAGRRGVCHVAPRTYQKDGQEYQTNNLKYLYPVWDQPNVEPVAQRTGSPAYQAPPPQYQQPYQQPAQGYAPPVQPSQGYQPPAQGWQPPQGGYQPNGSFGGGGR